ncbi:MAG: 3-hydroxyacyl-CoA dehydrogenase family protein [Flavobacteriaceae bacterium]
MKNIAVIGAGTMGNGIAHTFAQAGFKVQLTDTNPEALKKAIDTISTNLDRMISKEIITDIDKNKTLANISTYTSLNEGIEYASLVIEAATEDEAIKIEIFKELDALCPEDTILATNTSSISITQIASHTNRPEQVIGMHFMNPVPLMPLVEIILGYNTSSAVSKTIVELTEIIGKTPISVKDYPGFVANRILMPLINEAIETLYNGIAGVKEIDGIMKLGMGHPMGPLQLADFIGLDVCLSIMNVMYKGFKNPKYAPCPLLINMVNAKKLGIKSKEGFYDYTSSKKAQIVSSQFN